MANLSRIPTPAENGKMILAKRREIAAILEEVRASGKPQEIRQWETQLRKLDKLIAQYGLQRYA